MPTFLDRAITAHLSWKARLLAAIENPAKLDLKVIGADDQCELGKWIHGDGRRYTNNPDYERLVREHAHFHETAASVLRLIRQGKKDLAMMEIDGGEYSMASQNVITCLSSLKTSKTIVFA